MKVLLVIIALFFIANIANAQFTWTAPLSQVKKEKTNTNLKYRALAATATPDKIVNTAGISVSIPGYWYSNGVYQSVVVGGGYTFQHYVNDTLIYSLGPYVWYNTPIPTGSVPNAVGYGAAATYRGTLLLGFLTPDFVHFGPVLTLNFTFGNGSISLFK